MYRLLLFRFTSLFLSIALALPHSAYALRRQQSRQADHVRSGLEESLQAGLEERSSSKSKSSESMGPLRETDWLISAQEAAEQDEAVEDALAVALREIVTIADTGVIAVKPVSLDTLQVHPGNQIESLTLKELKQQLKSGKVRRFPRWKKRILAAILAIEHHTQNTKTLFTKEGAKRQIAVEHGRIFSYERKEPPPEPKMASLVATLDRQRIRAQREEARRKRAEAEEAEPEAPGSPEAQPGQPATAEEPSRPPDAASAPGGKLQTDDTPAAESGSALHDTEPAPTQDKDFRLKPSETAAGKAEGEQHDAGSQHAFSSEQDPGLKKYAAALADARDPAAPQPPHMLAVLEQAKVWTILEEIRRVLLSEDKPNAWRRVRTDLESVLDRLNEVYFRRLQPSRKGVTMASFGADQRLVGREEREFPQDVLAVPLALPPVSRAEPKATGVPAGKAASAVPAPHMPSDSQAQEPPDKVSETLPLKPEEPKRKEETAQGEEASQLKPITVQDLPSYMSEIAATVQVAIQNVDNFEGWREDVGKMGVQAGARAGRWAAVVAALVLAGGIALLSHVWSASSAPERVPSETELKQLQQEPPATTPQEQAQSGLEEGGHREELGGLPIGATPIRKGFWLISKPTRHEPSRFYQVDDIDVDGTYEARLIAWPEEEEKSAAQPIEIPPEAYRQYMHFTQPSPTKRSAGLPVTGAILPSGTHFSSKRNPRQLYRLSGVNTAVTYVAKPIPWPEEASRLTRREAEKGSGKEIRIPPEEHENFVRLEGEAAKTDPGLPLGDVPLLKRAEIASVAGTQRQLYRITDVETVVTSYVATPIPWPEDVPGYLQPVSPRERKQYWYLPDWGGDLIWETVRLERKIKALGTVAGAFEHSQLPTRLAQMRYSVLTRYPRMRRIDAQFEQTRVGLRAFLEREGGTFSLADREELKQLMANFRRGATLWIEKARQERLAYWSGFRRGILSRGTPITLAGTGVLILLGLWGFARFGPSIAAFWRDMQDDGQSKVVSVETPGADLPIKKKLEAQITPTAPPQFNLSLSDAERTSGLSAERFRVNFYKQVGGSYELLRSVEIDPQQSRQVPFSNSAEKNEIDLVTVDPIRPDGSFEPPQPPDSLDEDHRDANGNKASLRRPRIGGAWGMIDEWRIPLSAAPHSVSDDGNRITVNLPKELWGSLRDKALVLYVQDRVAQRFYRYRYEPSRGGNTTHWGKVGSEDPGWDGHIAFVNPGNAPVKPGDASGRWQAYLLGFPGHEIADAAGEPQALNKFKNLTIVIRVLLDGGTGGLEIWPRFPGTRAESKRGGLEEISAPVLERPAAPITRAAQPIIGPGQHLPPSAARIHPPAPPVELMDPVTAADQTFALMTAFDEFNRQMTTARFHAAPATPSATLDVFDLAAKPHHALALPYLPDAVALVSSSKILEPVELMTNRAIPGRRILAFSVEGGLEEVLGQLAQSFPAAETIRIHSTRPDAVRAAVHQATAGGVMSGVRFDVVQAAGLQELLLNIGVIDQGALDVLLNLIERAGKLIRYL